MTMVARGYRSRRRQPARKRGSLRIFLASVVVAAFTFLAGYFVAVRLLFPPLPVPEDGIIVPDITGSGFGQADAQLRGVGLALGDTVGVPHATMPPGIIVAQDPLPGQQLRGGGRVRVGVSTGLARMSVPDVTGFRAERAVNLLRRLGFDVDQQLQPDAQPAGTVLSTTPPAGTSRTLPSRVLLIVSDGSLPLVDTMLVTDPTTVDTTSVPW